jgi:dipeptidyl aminopeptidase/acylaminoacyl peptidase
MTYNTQQPPRPDVTPRSRLSRPFRLSRLLYPVLTGLLFATPAAAQRPVTVADLDSLRDVSDPQLSPDGAWVAYSVSTVDTARDADDSDVWMTSWDGARSIRLTRSPAGEHAPRWSPDGRSIAFLSSRDDPHESDQLWILDREGGDAERVTDLPGGVSDYAWAPDGRRLALIVSDPDSEATAKNDSTRKTAKPIVIDRYQFKEDETGYLTTKHDHLYLLDLATKQAELLLPGGYDEMFPSWSPDGRSIAFVSKRDPDPDRGANYDVWVVEARAGAQPRQLTTFKGSDQDPDWGGRGPAWSPDGRSIAYVQGGPPELIYYATQTVAIVPTAGGAPKVLTPGLDRQVLSPTWSADGSSVLFLLEDDRVYHLARVPAAGGAVERVVEGRQAVADLSVGGNGRIAVLTSDPRTPSEIYAVEQNGLRRLTHQNDAWLGRVKLGAVEEIAAKSKDGTSIHGFVVTPPDYEPGKRYPTVLRIHGGPVWQLFNDFANFDWQILAAQGYVVVAMNPRGSSGRGEKFTRAIWAAWGHKDTEDVLAGVDYLVAKGVADPERLGIGGWSYGGILTDNVIARDPRFKAATSGAGQGNALAGYGTDQYIREYEAELGKPWDKPDTWIRNSYPLLHANRIVTPTLFLCGDADFNVPLLNSEQMYQALKSLGRDTQLIIYPGEPHELHKPSNRRDRMQRYLDWYGKYLQPKGVVPTTTR